jgi:hypothetical protein
VAVFSAFSRETEFFPPVQQAGFALFRGFDNPESSISRELGPFFGRIFPSLAIEAAL